MTDEERRMLRTFISDRSEAAYKRLKGNKEYGKICERQNETEAIVDKLLHRLDDEERLSVRRHYEGETEKHCTEGYASYIQGLQDSVRILSLLGFFSEKVDLCTLF